MGSAQRAILDKYIAEFNEMYPNITIEHAQVGGYDEVRDQICTQITVGAQPNIAYCYGDHVALYNVAGAVVPLDGFIESNSLGFTEYELADFIEGFYNEGAMIDADGAMYMLPLSKSTEILYYNKTFFETHGLSVPTTWDEMEALCEQIKEIDPYCTPLGYDSEANWFITMCEQYGSPYTSLDDHYLFDNEVNRSFVARFRNWYQNGWVTTSEIYGGYMSNLLVSGDVYMVIGSSAGARYYDSGAFEVGMSSIPQVDPYNPKAISQGPSVCIFKQDNYQEVAASWIFVKYLTTSVEFQAELSMSTGYIPVIESVLDNPIYQEFLESDDLRAQALRTALENSDSFFASPSFNGSAKAREQVGELMIYCFTVSTDTVEETIKKAFEFVIEYCLSNE
jgi:multiple sugar transport system substrate-binding protein